MAAAVLRKSSRAKAATSVKKKASTATKNQHIEWRGHRITAFEKSVYELISTIPEGKVSTYGAIAKALNSGPRPVGQALRKNPFAPQVPCHRVVAGNLDIGGFKGSKGEESPHICEKRELLGKEGVKFTHDLKIPPLTNRQRAECDVPDAHALERDHIDAHVVAHASDVAVLPLRKHHAQLVFVQDLYALGLVRDALGGHAASQFAQLALHFFGRFVQLDIDAHEVFLLHAAIWVQDALRQRAVLREDEQTGRVHVQTTAHCHLGQQDRLARFASGLGLVELFALVVVREQLHSGHERVFGLRRHKAQGLVEQHGHLLSLVALRWEVELHVGVQRYEAPVSLDLLAVDEHGALLDVHFGLAPRAEPALRHELGQADLAFAHAACAAGVARRVVREAGTLEPL